MKTSKASWNWIEEHFRDILAVLLVALTGVMGLLVGVLPGTFQPAVCIALSLIAASVLVLPKRVLCRLPCNSPARGIEDFIKEYSHFAQSIRNDMEAAREVWVLTRTGQGFIAKYEDDVLKPSVKRGVRFQFLLLDPRDGALRMIKDNYHPPSANVIRRSIYDVVERLRDCRDDAKPEAGGVDVHVLDYLAAWSLIICDPRERGGSMYVELATYIHNADTRPTFKLLAGQDRWLFDRLRTDFERMWKKAEDGCKLLQQTEFPGGEA
jgi:hypothetical protein